jgi:hypothetical protein
MPFMQLDRDFSAEQNIFFIMVLPHSISKATTPLGAVAPAEQ